MRKQLIAGNWKMNGSKALLSEMVQTLNTSSKLQSQERESVICPPSVYLNELATLTQSSPLQVGAQNVYYEEKGAYTGELSVAMLKDSGVSHSIIGHSERRSYFKESNQEVLQKAKMLLQHKCTPILCIGEVLADREAGRHIDVVCQQVLESLGDLTTEDLSNTVLAYEPVWAIGTGKTASSEQAQEMHHEIRKTLAQKWGEACANGVRILYGGSAKANNASSLLSQSDIDGLLVGGASLNPQEFLQIIEA